jgi:pyruvate dehydrogenase E2 component (dihydrolipoamide acetyltransferase)
MEEGTLAKWLVKEGDSVQAGDLLAEIETDKATMEFEAVDDGVIAQILVAEGTDGVKVGEVIAMLTEEGGASTAAPVAAPAAAAKASPSAKKLAAELGIDLTQLSGTGPEGRIVKEDVERAAASGDNSPSTAAATKPEPLPAAAAPTVGAVPDASESSRVKASPLARRLAAAQGLELAHISGSGPGGRIVKADIDQAQPVSAAPAAAAPVVSAAPASAPVPAPLPSAPAPTMASDIPHRDERLSNMRKTIARRLASSMQEAPHIYLSVDVRLDALLKLRSEINAGLEARGIKLSVNDMLIKALALALEAVPDCNVSFMGDTLRRYDRQDVSVAVSIPGGLITPIIVDAANKPLSKIATEMKDLAARAQEGKLQPSEYQGGTASLSNMGMMGIKHFTAVINPPQAMILAVGAGEKRPHVIDDSLQIATMMTVTGSFDHRAIDGADGAKLLAAFKALVEKPMGLVA